MTGDPLTLLEQIHQHMRQHMPEADLSTPAIQRVTRDRLRKALADAGDDCAITIGTGHLRLVLDLLDACAPPAPTPDAGSDLAKLSAAASQGEWKLSGQRMGGDWIIATAERVVANCRPWTMRSEDDRNKQDGAFIVALVNAYRSGLLVEASASPPPAEDLAGQGEPVAWAVEAASAAYYDGMTGTAEERWPHHTGWAGKSEAFKEKVRAHMARALKAAVTFSGFKQKWRMTDETATTGRDGPCQIWISDRTGHSQCFPVGVDPNNDAAPAPSRPADREEIASAVIAAIMGMDWAEVRSHAYWDGDADEEDRRHGMIREAVLLALRDAPRAGGDGTKDMQGGGR